MVLRRIARGLARFQRPVIRGTRRVILAVSLFLLYFVGLGLSRALMSLFARRTLHHRPPGDRGWREATGYDLDPAALVKQS